MNAGIICDYLKSQGFTCDVRYFNDGAIELMWAPDTSEEVKKAAQALIDAGIPEPPSPADIDSFKERVFGALPDLGKLQMAPVLMSMNQEFINNPTNMQMYWGALLSNRPEWLTDKVLFEVGQIAQECRIPIVK